jgi:hypothetical protein
MPTLNSRIFSTHTIRVSRVIKAPLRFVYNWCTDFREDDNKLTGSKNRRKILQKNKRRVVYVTTYFPKPNKIRIGVNLVTLHPPNSWHLDFIGEEDYEEGDYHLTRLGSKKTRLDMRFREQYRVRNVPSAAEDKKGTEELWDKYVAALERDYSRT